MPNVSPVGKLRNKITIQNNVLSSDTFGGYSTANTSFLTAFAQIKPKSAKQIFNEQTGEQIANPQDFEFIIRHRDNINVNMRILFGTRTFDIISVEDDNEYHRYIKIIAREKVAT